MSKGRSPFWGVVIVLLVLIAIVALLTVGMFDKFLNHLGQKPAENSTTNDSTPVVPIAAQMLGRPLEDVLNEYKYLGYYPNEIDSPTRGFPDERYYLQQNPSQVHYWVARHKSPEDDFCLTAEDGFVIGYYTAINSEAYETIYSYLYYTSDDTWRAPLLQHEPVIEFYNQKIYLRWKIENGYITMSGWPGHNDRSDWKSATPINFAIHKSCAQDMSTD